MKELTIEERMAWFEASLRECCSSVNTLNDERFLSVLFEDLCIDVVSCFSEYSLNALIDAEKLSEEDKYRCFKIRDLFMANENEFRACSEPAKIKSMEQWKEINDTADVVLDNYILTRQSE